MAAVDDEVVALGLARDRLADRLAERLVGLAGPERRAQVGGIVLTEKGLGSGLSLLLAIYGRAPLQKAPPSRPPLIFDRVKLEVPPNVVVEIVSAEPGFKGDSVSNLLKNATTQNGIAVKVPLFIKEGDKIKVDTRTGEYVERV